MKRAALMIFLAVLTIGFAISGVFTAEAAEKDKYGGTFRLAIDVKKYFINSVCNLRKPDIGFENGYNFHFICFS